MSEPTCIDLREWCKAHRYRWHFEESYLAEKPENRGDGRWYVEVLCKHGLIYPHGGNTLLAYASRGSKRHIAKLAGVEHHQTDGDAEVFRFPAERLDEVAAILKPRQKRSYSPEELERKRERLRVAREHKKSLTGTRQESPETPQGVVLMNDQGLTHSPPFGASLCVETPIQPFITDARSY